MKKDKYNEKQFLEYLDRMLAGEDISLGDGVSDEVRSALELASKMLVYRDEPSADFRANLRNRLQHQIAQQDAAAPAHKRSFWEWGTNLFPPRSIIIGLTSTALVVLLIFVGTVWYSSRYSGAPMLSETPTMDKYAVNLPANIVPEGVTAISKISLETAAAKAPVYQVKKADITASSVTELGRKLGFSGKASSIEGGDKIAMYQGEGDNARQLIAWTASGAIEYGYVEPDRLYPAYSLDMPSQQLAELIAYEFLAEADLLPPAYQNLAKIKDETAVTAGGFSREHAEAAAPAATMPSPPSEAPSPPSAPSAPSLPSQTLPPSEEAAAPAPSAVTYWLVEFPYFVDGMEATGPGSKMEVSVGNGGEVIRALWPWRQMSPVSDEDIISQKQAYEDLIQGKGSLDIPLDCSRLVVEQVQLKYWLDPPSEKQVYAVPVYEFTGQCLDKNGRHLEDFTGWTPALSRTY